MDLSYIGSRQCLEFRSLDSQFYLLLFYAKENFVTYID